MEEEEGKSVKDLSDLELSWLILKWILASQGVGRGQLMSGRLLHLAIAMMGEQEVFFEYYVSQERALLEEAGRRIEIYRKHPRPLQTLLPFDPPFDSLEFQSDHVIAHILLDQLDRWYRQKTIELGAPLGYLHYEALLFRFAFAIFPFGYLASSSLYAVKYKVVIQEAEGREKERSVRKQSPVLR
ncbi:MAG: hypothetical protein WC516_01150 [Patescibacteria group bacterium]